MVKKDKSLIKEFVRISKYFGQRFDLIQAAGGNSSIKDGHKMYIKSSGYSLAEVSEKNGYSLLDNRKLMDFLRINKDVKITSKIEKSSFNTLRKSIISGNAPSIETFTHSMLKKYTIHFHPVSVNVISTSTKSRRIFKEIFHNEILDKTFFYIKYKTPGIALASEILKIIGPHENKISKNENIVLFLENHGLICSSDNADKLIKYIEDVMIKFEKYCNLDFARYKNTSIISQILWKHKYKELVTYYSEDKLINSFLTSNPKINISKPLNPDQLLYCGESILNIKKSLDLDISKFIRKFKTYPRVIIVKNSAYFISSSILKAREVEDVFKSHLYFHYNSFGASSRKLSKENIKRLDSYNPQKNRLRFWFDYLK